MLMLCNHLSAIFHEIFSILFRVQDAFMSDAAQIVKIMNAKKK